jgi:hypothetical protein
MPKVELLDPKVQKRINLLPHRYALRQVNNFIFCRLDFVRELNYFGRLEQTCTQFVLLDPGAVGIGKVSGLIYFF